METDALFVLVAGMRLAVDGRLGFWIGIPGLLRYVYAAAIRVFPATRGEAPRSALGRYAFALLVVSFAVSAWPIEPVHRPFAAIATFVMACSFGRSAWWSFGPARRVRE